MKRLFQSLNIVSLLFALVMNGLVGAQLLGLPAINEVSDVYATVLTPAGYAFSIWSLIFISLIGFVIYQARDFFRPTADNILPQKTGPLFIIASIMNGLWTFAFVSDQLFLSVIILVLLTLCLYLLLVKLDIAIKTPSLKTAAFVWWPLLIYTGWVTVATIVNIESWLQSIDVTITPAISTIVLILLTSALIVLLALRNVRELLFASAWGIAAVGVQQSMTGGSHLVAVSAFACAGILLLSCLLHAIIMVLAGKRPIRLQ